MRYFNGLVKNLCLVGNTALDHVGDDPMLFAVQVSRRLPASMAQAVAALGRKTPATSSWHPFSLFLAGDVDAASECLSRGIFRARSSKKSVRLGQIALAANLPELADELVSSVPSGSQDWPPLNRVADGTAAT
ncbi:hypothetical protein OL239_07120 [Arthrobacter sp. ATA002]|uniref:hypothetical protein n=1 Tax=Arthrobacter sp. ATA002 TaxID=2991715 RepID=UPI0022A6E950|nr:hypothetical protein [Arthrobacter sp. ATA002]WAP52902.1 hypothetical protein OL239_07120 [Arthrobacter sp. ATA002]